MRSDDQNLMLVENPDMVDKGNTEEFYAKEFPYPWPPMSFPRLEDPDFEEMMLNQSLGDFNHGRMPANANTWVAGCGAN